MSNFTHRTTKQYLRSADPNGLPELKANYIENSAEADALFAAGVPTRYWNIVGDLVTEMSVAEKAAVDAIAETARLDSIADEFDSIGSLDKAAAQAYIDEFNTHSLRINAILDAIDGAGNFSQVKAAIAAINDINPRTLAQIKAAVLGFAA